MEPWLATQTSAPSHLTICGSNPTVVNPTAASARVVQNRPSAARLLPRLRTPSTDRDRNAAIWRRETLAEGSKVVAVVPVVMPM